MSTAIRRDDTTEELRAPLVLRWERSTNPLPVRPVRQPAGTSRRPVHASETPPWLNSGEAGAPFEFCHHVRLLCADIARRCDTFRHVQIDHLLIGMIQARSGRNHGLQARVTPLRFRDGQLTRRRNTSLYQVQRYIVDGREVLYLMTFCLPRFLEQSFEDKLITLFHELYHIGPTFNGDLRRHGGRYEIHSHSKVEYDRQMALLAREYLETRPDPSLHAFLRLNFAQLTHRHGSVLGVVVPRPKVVPLSG